MVHAYNMSYDVLSKHFTFQIYRLSFTLITIQLLYLDSCVSDKMSRSIKYESGGPNKGF